MGTGMSNPGAYYNGSKCWALYGDKATNPYLDLERAEAWEQGYADAREEEYEARKAMK